MMIDKSPETKWPHEAILTRLVAVVMVVAAVLICYNVVMMVATIVTDSPSEQTCSAMTLNEKAMKTWCDCEIKAGDMRECHLNQTMFAYFDSMVRF